MKLFSMDTIPSIAALIGAGISMLLGPMNGLLYTLIAFVCMDYITGIIAAMATGTLSSRIGFLGIAKKVLIFFIVCLVNLLEVNVIGTEGATRAAVIFFYLANEGISIMENVVRLGVPLPSRLVNILKQLKEEEEAYDE